MVKFCACSNCALIQCVPTICWAWSSLYISVYYSSHILICVILCLLDLSVSEMASENIGPSLYSCNFVHCGFLYFVTSMVVAYIFMSVICIFYFLFRQHWFITSCRFHVDKLCFYFCIPCSMLTTKNLVFIHYHKVDPIYPFCPPH